MKKTLIEIISFLIICVVVIKCPALSTRVSNFLFSIFDTNKEASVSEDTITFNAGVVLNDNTVDYTSCLLTFKIDEESIVYTDGYIGFLFNPINVECSNELKNNPLIWTLTAYDSKTEKLLPTYYNDNGTNFECYIIAKDVPIEDIALMFSGSAYDETAKVLDDYILDQSSTSKSILKSVKLVS